MNDFVEEKGLLIFSLAKTPKKHSYLCSDALDLQTIQAPGGFKGAQKFSNSIFYLNIALQLFLRFCRLLACV